ncbi:MULTISPECIES: prepilin peptidase-dependent protein [Phytobacter]|uniref:Prepilin peptidase dependent protein B n=1 Tax=Phytobacter diazotrophicus TaxID=395631 RepID=A0ABN6LNB7_9ENTR|nr:MULTISPECIES: prepilin peptidase-dependent protein [Phytobacter]MDU4153076.1 prepilin peptidase-dependent protein [Enterobacteriaceae bacterium]MDU7379081.1 prepilin peptidase-dependent protein [Enterobacteriaceae bacterium]BBE75938.1 prepilin peptidase dependent protein B [Phytobacter sp. MRY16-398]BDD49470.1 prepilin peptidase dependent protein B [Phytobacter diazotrophicus]BEG80501.1 prepilin peptidase-dependent protein [Phytobacter diazotrophicus]
MLDRQQGFSLLETLLAMAIGSVILLAAARFLPALQFAVLQQTRHQMLEDELWQRLYTVARHIQRAGYCNGECVGQALTIGRNGSCVVVQWDANSNGRWETSPASDADQTGFRLQNGVLETLRGATSCEGKGWDKMTDPNTVDITLFTVTRQQTTGLAPVFTISLAGQIKEQNTQHISAAFSVSGFNL